MKFSFFGVSCLAVKVNRCWSEFQPEQYPGLRKRLLDTMTAYQGPKIVLTRICVAVSGLVIHCVPGHWPEPITDIISMFQPQLTGPNPNYRSLTLLLELLTVIPEEFSTLLLTSNRRATVRNAFSSSLPFCLKLWRITGKKAQIQKQLFRHASVFKHGFNLVFLWTVVILLLIGCCSV